ncbi:MAG TPA: pepsin/retropepsin-like aspartic protease family protein [Vicinamibacterales bacterium]|nr:pepsin/retropepsin-like aspartic protease family protein [Vicinamibacterales bacterium]
MRKRFRYGCVLIVPACVACAAPTPPGAQTVAPATAAMADEDIRDYQLRTLETRIQTMPEGPERNYFSGMLAARSGRFGDAIAQINRALPHLRESAPERAALALEAIATAYRANNQYGDAARAYVELSDRFANQLNHFPYDDAALARILNGTPPQTISWHGPVKLKTLKNPIGSRVAEFVVNGVRGPWLLDTGANQSVVSRTFAERLGLTPLPGAASGGSGLTGRKSSLRVAVLPTMQVGGAALTNVVLVIIDDENLRIGSGPDAYQLNAVLGYPILKALGVVTFTPDEFLAGEAAEANDQSMRMYMRGLTPAIESEVEGKPLLFTFDTGASSTDLSVRYYELFRAQVSSWKTQLIESGGVGGSVKRELYVQPRLVMKVGTSTATLQDVSITPIRVNAGLDILFGNLGQDFVDRFESVSLNFSTMTFSLGAPRTIR